MKIPTAKINTGKSFFQYYFLIFFLVACKGTDRDSDATQETTNQTSTVEVVHPARRAFSGTIQITGSAMPFQQVTLFAMESGYVSNIRKEIGDAVMKGEVVAQLNNPNITQLVKDAEADIELAAAEITMAEAQLDASRAGAESSFAQSERLQSIFAKTPQLTPLMEVEKAGAAAKEAAARVKMMEAQLLAKKSQHQALFKKLETAQVKRNMLSVRAPFSGIITQRYVDQGALVQSGLTEDSPQGIAELQQTNPIRLTIPLPEADATLISKGMLAEVSFPELPGAGFSAKVSRTSQALDPASKTMQLEIDIENPDKTIISGMYAKANLQLKSREEVLSLPINAQVMYQDEPSILAVDDGTVKRIMLKKGLANNEYFEILNVNITEETLVIVKGKSQVKEGQVVNPILKK